MSIVMWIIIALYAEGVILFGGDLDRCKAQFSSCGGYQKCFFCSASDTLCETNFDHFWGLFAWLYSTYCLEAILVSKTLQYLTHIKLRPEVIDYYNDMRSKPPFIQWRIECWHWETRTRVVTDSNGNTRTETYQERVVTHTARKVNTINKWTDASFPSVCIIINRLVSRTSVPVLKNVSAQLRTVSLFAAYLHRCFQVCILFVSQPCIKDAC